METAQSIVETMERCTSTRILISLRPHRPHPHRPHRQHPQRPRARLPLLPRQSPQASSLLLIQVVGLHSAATRIPTLSTDQSTAMVVTVTTRLSRIVRQHATPEFLLTTLDLKPVFNVSVATSTAPLHSLTKRSAKHCVREILRNTVARMAPCTSTRTRISPRQARHRPPQAQQARHRPPQAQQARHRPPQAPQAPQLLPPLHRSTLIRYILERGSRMAATSTTGRVR